MKISEEGYTMPLGRSPYNEPPFPAGRNAELLWIEYEADVNSMISEIPEPLKLPEDYPVVVWIFDAPQSTGAIYHEGAILIPVKYKNIVGHYVAYIWGDLDQPMFLNREVYGWPQLLCDSDPLNKVGNHVTGYIKRHNQTLVELSLFLDKPCDAAKEKTALLPDWLQLRKFPHVSANGDSLRQVMHTVVSDITIHSFYTGTCSLKLRDSPEFPIGKLSPKKILKGYYATVTFDLPLPKGVWTV